MRLPWRKFLSSFYGLPLLVLLISNDCIGVEKAEIMTITQVLNVLQDKKPEFDAKIAEIKKQGIIKHVYLYALEIGENCNSKFLEKIELNGGYATIDDLRSDNYLRSIVECPHLQPAKFCATQNKARRQECVDRYLSNATNQIESLINRMEFSLNLTKQSGKRFPEMDMLHGNFLTEIWVNLALRNRYTRELQDSESSNCTSHGGNACAIVARIDAIQRLGKEQWKAVNKQLDKWPKSIPPIKKAVAEFRLEYPKIWNR